jgi:hypothetical protein
MSEPVYKLRWRGREIGPWPQPVIEQKLDGRELGLWHEIFADGKWTTLNDFLESRPARIELPKPVSTKIQIDSEPSLARFIPAVAARPRRRIIFVLLGICFGFLGLHNFYARHFRMGILQLSLSSICAVLGVGVIVVWLWAMVETILVWRDPKGLPMT